LSISSTGRGSSAFLGFTTNPGGLKTLGIEVATSAVEKCRVPPSKVGRGEKAE
jgi:hypothetical protein